MSTFTQQLERNLNQLAIFLQEDIKRQLIDDGHRATGELVESIKAVVSKGSDMYVIEGSMAKHGLFIISGREKGAKGVPIDALIKWISNKGFTQGIKETKGMAFAIQKTIKKKGIKSNDFIGKVFDKNKSHIDAKVNESVRIALDLSIKNLITNAQQFS